VTGGQKRTLYFAREGKFNADPKAPSGREWNDWERGRLNPKGKNLVLTGKKKHHLLETAEEGTREEGP